MPMKLTSAFKIVFISLIFLISTFCFAQETGKVKDSADAAAIFEQVLRSFEMKKQQEQDALAEKLHRSLNQITADWIDSAKSDKHSKIGTRLKQSWEKLAATFKIAPRHYEYYLRGYKYSTLKSDVVRSDSLTTPYKADVVISEELYVEKYHSPDVSDTNPYFYTVTTHYNLHFEYRDDKFVLSSSDDKVVGFVNDAPLEIKKPKHLF
ncbi:MAG: hypothetical protein PHR84_03295 [Candidatus Omnitrophica bacterium]|jgi:hypothetical protein|nr:hypothetical protein [Candidatus Omnitrophota bacterium]MDD5661042.1 hypothetical protein [Candidatus Omnitrophota bacterium]